MKPDASTVVPDLRSALSLAGTAQRIVREHPQRAAALAEDFDRIALLLRRCLSVLDTNAERGIPPEDDA